MQGLRGRVASFQQLLVLTLAVAWGHLSGRVARLEHSLLCCPRPLKMVGSPFPLFKAIDGMVLGERGQLGEVEGGRGGDR